LGGKEGKKGLYQSKESQKRKKEVRKRGGVCLGKEKGHSRKALSSLVSKDLEEPNIKTNPRRMGVCGGRAWGGGRKGRYKGGWIMERGS